MPLALAPSSCKNGSDVKESKASETPPFHYSRDKLLNTLQANTQHPWVLLTVDQSSTKTAVECLYDGPTEKHSTTDELRLWGIEMRQYS